MVVGLRKADEVAQLLPGMFAVAIRCAGEPDNWRHIQALTGRSTRTYVHGRAVLGPARLSILSLLRANRCAVVFPKRVRDPYFCATPARMRHAAELYRYREREPV